MKDLRKFLVPAALLSTMMAAACGDEATPPVSMPEDRLTETPQATRDVTPEPVAPMLPADVAPAPVEPERPEIDVPEVRMDENSTDQAAATYTVEAGDTLYSIARKHDVDYAELMRWNQIDDPNLIQVGQEIKVSVDSAK